MKKTEGRRSRFVRLGGCDFSLSSLLSFVCPYVPSNDLIFDPSCTLMIYDDL